MGILGLTHDENGTALEKLPVTIKVAIGEGPEPGSENGPSAQAGSFRFQTENASRARRSVGTGPGDRSSTWREADRTGNHLPQRRSARSLPNGVCICGRRADANAEANLCRSRMGTAPDSKCKRLGELKSIPRVRPGLATTSTSMARKRASRLSLAATGAQTWTGVIAGHREIFTSSWRNFRCSGRSADFTPVAIDRFAIFRTA